METREVAKGNWKEIFEHYGLPPINEKSHYPGLSPCCKRKGKIRIDDKEGRGTFICACGEAGDGFDLVRLETGKSFKEIALEIDRLLDNKHKKKHVQKDLSYIYRARNSIPVKGSNVERYLNSRGIYTLPQQALFASQGNMFCIAVNENLKAAYTHETFLDGDVKSSREVNRKLLSIGSESRQAAIRLFEQSEVLGIAEGVETALSCKQIYRINTWSVISGVFMKKFRAPQGVKKLFIFSDNDRNGVGLAAAFECASRNVLSKNDVKEVVIRWRMDEGDFNDQLSDPCEVCEWRLHG